ncbi:unnamed protein product [Paramecium octaurelia]|uniref:RING-type domain-containing protein n=1 Tax=Paramecium octaurelia TaxID=43137 RepID=A0A8S1WNL2_PAROT|nr:unnamed protein product [Paramecium octaurelia]
MFSIIKYFNFYLQIFNQNLSNNTNTLITSLQHNHSKASHQNKFKGKFQGMNQKTERIIQKLQSTKEQLQLSIENNNSNKKSKLNNKLQNLEAELQKINQKDQVAKDYHLVYDGLIQQLQITQDQKIGALSQSQRNQNLQILCSIKKQAINLQSQVLKKNILIPLFKFAINVMILILMQISQQDENNLFKYQKDKQFQSQYNIYDCKNSQRNKSNEYEEKNLNNILKNLSTKQTIWQNKKDMRKKGIKNHTTNLKNHQALNNLQILLNNLIIQKLKISNKKISNINKKITKLDDSNLYQICFEFPKQYVPSPCGHFTYCHNCKELALKQCLICREPVQLPIKVFKLY